MTNIELIIKHAQSQTLSLATLKVQCEIYDNIKIICRAKVFFATNVERIIDYTARDLFEIESLGYNYTIIENN